MKVYSILILALSSIFVISCKTNKAFSEMSKDDILITMKKGACFGSCPVYTLSIYDGGFAHFEGKNYTDKNGSWLRKLDKKTYKSLIYAFENSNFTAFKDMYESEIMDLQTVKIGYKGKFVTGKNDRPAGILDLQKLLEKIVEGQDNWSSLDKDAKSGDRKEVEKKKADDKKVDYIYNEIIIEPKAGYPLTKVLKKYKNEYGLRLLKKISPDMNLWLITYDNNNHEPKSVLNMLKGDKGIKHAEFNAKTTYR